MRVKYLKPILVAGTLIGLSQWSGLSFAQSAEQLYNRSLAATCANCHGTDGKGVVDGGMPLINNKTQSLQVWCLRGDHHAPASKRLYR